MHLPSAFLALPLLFAPLLAAVTPPEAPGAPIAPAVASPSASEQASDPELAMVRVQVESAGMRVVELFRTPEDGRIIAGKVRLAGSSDSRLRGEDVMVFIERPRASGGHLARFCLLAWERPDIAEDRASEARERLERIARRARFLHLRPWEAEQGDEEDDEEDGRKHLLVAFQHVPAADPRAFAAFVDDLAVELSAVLGVEAGDGPFLLYPGERERKSLLNSYRCRWRSLICSDLYAE